MKQVSAKVISFIFHPIFLATILPFLIIYHSTTSIKYGVQWSLISLVFVFAVLVVLFLFRPKEFFTDIDISKREKRPLLYAISLFFSILYFILAVYLKGIFFPLTLVSLGIILGLVIFELANMLIKVSIHMAVSCAFMASYGLLYGQTALLYVVWVPVAVAWSRLILHKHTKIELIAGGIIGFAITFLTFAIAQLIR